MLSNSNLLCTKALVYIAFLIHHFFLLDPVALFEGNQSLNLMLSDSDLIDINYDSRFCSSSKGPLKSLLKA